MSRAKGAKRSTPKPKTIGIVGSRRRDSPRDLRLTRAAVESRWRVGDYLVSGGCNQGGDSFAELLARDLGSTIIIHHADWHRHGRAAGFLRNTQIAADADVLIAVVADDRAGGTEDAIRKFLDGHGLTEADAIQQGRLVLV